MMKMKGSGMKGSERVRLIRALVIHLKEKTLETCTRSIVSVILFACALSLLHLPHRRSIRAPVKI